MRSLRILTSVCVLFALLGANSVPFRVPQNDIDAENARWSALGAKLPIGGILLAHPYDPPYSNRSFVVPFSWYKSFYGELRAKHDVAVDAAALRADLPVLRFLIAKTYAGYEPAAARGWSWDRMFREWDTQLAHGGGQKLTLRAAFAPWGRLEDAQLDNHSGVPGLMAYVSGSVSAALDAKPSAPCTSLRASDGRRFALSASDLGQQPHAVQAWNGSQLSPAWYISYPKRLGTAAALQCGDREIGLAMAAQVQAPSDTPVYKTLADGIAYLRMPTFTDANNEALRAALAKAPHLGKERLVIFDLRGNDGGNAPADLLTTWFAESALEEAAAQSTQFGTQSCFRTALFFGLQQQLAAGIKPPVSAPLQQELQGLIDALTGSATPNCRVEPTVVRGDRNLRDHTFDLHVPQTDETRVVALVDNGCGSDCEYMTYILSGLPNNVIVGTSTEGVMGFTQPGYFVLPHSRIPFRLALSRTDEYGDGRSVDGYGITVDVLLPTAASQSEPSLTALAQALLH